MATTTNYGWTTPDDTDLVKNGASAIRSLGTSVDTALWSAGYSAGKNKIINGDMTINQRAYSSGTSNAYTVDRWYGISSGGTATRSVQTFTAGAAPVAGYEATNFLRMVTASQAGNGDYAAYYQPIEDVRTFAGQTVTVSFWAKASTGTPKVGITAEQNFGSGGSASVLTSNAATTISTSWARYSVTLTIPSISGKTIGTSSFLAIWLFTSCGSTVSGSGYPAIGLQNATIDIWGVQAEAGSTATPFQTATGNKASELVACQRYYYRTAYQGRYGSGFAKTTTTAEINVPFPVQMRKEPTALEQSGTAGDYLIVYQNTAAACSSVPTYNNASYVMGSVIFTVGSGLTAGNGVSAGYNGTTGYLGWSAEL